MEWAEETIIRLRALWDEGHSTAEIGRRLSVSKNAVVGKAHRLDLPARPSPIRRDGSGTSAPRRSTPRRVAGPTLPPLSSTASMAGTMVPSRDRNGAEACTSTARGSAGTAPLRACGDLLLAYR
jgi:GcrA cell cycle regulator